MVNFYLVLNKKFPFWITKNLCYSLFRLVLS